MLSKLKLNSLKKSYSILSSEFPKSKSGFVLEKFDFIEPLHSHVLQYRHEATDAEYVHIARNDVNNVFCVMFRTPPGDDSGVAHILEHTTLCGSQKFPVRDPFFKMLNRSVATFMNAMTGPDFTMYPFATPNKIDFDNLFTVYMDAVFHPLLRDDDFHQEGWRLDHAVTGDTATPIGIKGVVYNEMKGAMSDNDTLFRTKWQQALFRGSPYGFDSGGIPHSIPQLSYEGLIDFHKTHYTPSNARFFTFGDIPVSQHLEKLGVYLQSLSGSKRKIELKDPEFAGKLMRVADFGPVDPMLPPGKQVKWLYSFATSRQTEPFETFTVQLLSRLLLQGAGSPLYKALIESQIGTEYAPGTGFNATSNQTVVSFGLQGLANDDLEKARAALRDCLTATINTGFPSERLDAVLAEIELALKHRTSEFGLGLLWGIYDSWNHGADPAAYLAIDRNIARLRTEVERNPRYLQDKLSQYFDMSLAPGNSFQMDFTLLPDEGYSSSLKRNEALLVTKLSDRLSVKDHEQIAAANVQLMKKQLENNKVSESLIAKLPTIALCDIPKQGNHFAISRLDDTLWTRSTETNGIAYAQSEFSISGLDSELLPLVPFWCDAVTQVGTKTHTAAEMDQRVRLKTGGIRFAPLVKPSQTSDSIQLYVIMSSHCLEANEGSMADLSRQFLYDVDFTTDMNKLQVYMQRATSDMVNSVADRGSKLALLSSAANTAQPFAVVGELWDGFTALEYAVKITSGERYAELADRLNRISEFVRGRFSRMLIHSESDAKTPKLQSFAHSMRAPVLGAVSDTHIFENLRPSPDLLWETAFETGYSGLSMRGPHYSNSQQAISASLLAKIISTAYLHPVVREKGGAYGSGARYSALEGHWAFYSYRDPLPFNSIRVFKDGFKDFESKHSSGQLSQRILDEAKLSLLKANDAPLSVFDEGLLEFRYGITKEIRQIRRDLIFSAKFDDLLNVSRFLELELQQAKSCVLSPKQEEYEAGYQVRSLKY